MVFKGEGVRSKAVHDVLSKHKKDQKHFLHIDLTYYQGNKMCIHTLSCLLYNEACHLNRNTGTNIYMHFQQRVHV